MLSSTTTSSTPSMSNPSSGDKDGYQMENDALLLPSWNGFQRLLIYQVTDLLTQ
jgi:hypothetical protein